MLISDLKVGSSYSGILQIRSISRGQTKSNEPYVFVNVGDITGEVTLKIWSIEPELSKLLNDDVIGQYLKLDERPVSQYQENLELTSQGGVGVALIREEIMEKDPNFNLEDFAKGAPETSHAMMQEIMKFIRFEIINPEIRRLIATIFDKYKEEFPSKELVGYEYPGGLLYKTISELRFTKGIVELYPYVNESLIYGGIIMANISYIVDDNKEDRNHLVSKSFLLSKMIVDYSESLKVEKEIGNNLIHMIELERFICDEPISPEGLVLRLVTDFCYYMEDFRLGSLGLERGQITIDEKGQKYYLPEIE